MRLGVFSAAITPDGVVRIVATGAFAPEALVSSAEIHWAATPKHLIAGERSAILLDLRLAYAANGNRSILNGAKPVFPRFMRELPTALIATPEALGFARDYTMLGAALGVVVGAFTCERAGLAWAQARARALSAQKAQSQRI